jgi:small subunit ribosomal protein S19
MSRSFWKGPFLDTFLLKSSQVLQKKHKQFWSRNSVIPAYLQKKIVFIYNGKMFNRLEISRKHIGFKFGEFSFTRKYQKKKIKTTKKVVKPTAKVVVKKKN